MVLCQVGDLLLEAAALYEKRRAYVLQAEALVLFPLLSYAVLTYSIARRCPVLTYAVAGTDIGCS